MHSNSNHAHPPGVLLHAIRQSANASALFGAEYKVLATRVEFVGRARSSVVRGGLKASCRVPPEILNLPKARVGESVEQTTLAGLCKVVTLFDTLALLVEDLPKLHTS